MATLTIEGKKVKVDDAFLSMSPDEQAKAVDEIAAQIGVTPVPQESDQSKAVREDLAATSNKFFQGKPDGVRTADSFIRGAADTAAFGMSDELAAAADRNNPIDPRNYDSLSNAANAISNLNPITNMINQVGDIVSPDEETQSRLRQERAFQSHREDIDSGAMTAGRISGALLGAGGLVKARAPFMAALPADASLGAKIAQGAKAGALYSGLYGAGSGEGVQDRAEEAATGALLGGAIGGAVPAVAAGIKSVTKPVTDAVTGYFRPETFANRKIAERLANDIKTPTQAADEMANNPGMALADVAGDSTRNLLRSAANVPGKAQSKIRARLNLRQMQQGDRILSAVRKTLADPDGYLTAKDTIANDAKKLAKPLYDEAYKTPVPFTQSLESILETPAGRRALAQAEQLAANEQKPFQQFFINMVDDTTGTIKRVPDARGWDYIKRGFDDVIQSEKAGTFGQMNNQARIITDLKNQMLKEIDAANPAYAQARSIWSSQAGMDDALEAGRISLKQSPEATRRMLGDMSEAEKQMFRVGMADAIRDKIGGGNFTHNALLKFFSSKDQIGNLRAAFASDEQFGAFRKAMFAEAQKRATYNTVTGNSTTARQLADMADAGGLKEGVDFVKDAATGGITSATLRWVGSRLKMLGGFTPEVADQVSRKLLAADPATVRNITAELMKIDQQRISADQKRQLIQRVITPLLAIPAQTASGQ